MRRILLTTCAILIALPILLIAGCSQQENPLPSIGTTPSSMTFSGSQTSSQAVMGPGTRASGSDAANTTEPSLLEAKVYRGADAVPPNLLVTFSEPEQLALIAEALLHKDRLSGMFSIRIPDYAIPSTFLSRVLQHLAADMKSILIR